MLKVICKVCRKDTAKEGFQCDRRICPYDQFEIVTVIPATKKPPKLPSRKGAKAPKDKSKIPSTSS